MAPAIVRYHWANPSSATATTCIRVKHLTFTFSRTCIVKYLVKNNVEYIGVRTLDWLKNNFREGMPQKDAKTDNRGAHKNIKEEAHDVEKEDKENKGYCFRRTFWIT